MYQNYPLALKLDDEFYLQREIDCIRHLIKIN